MRALGMALGPGGIIKPVRNAGFHQVAEVVTRQGIIRISIRQCAETVVLELPAPFGPNKAMMLPLEA